MEASTAGDAMTPAAVLDAMPHRSPFRFIDEILELDEDHIVAAYRYSADADFYRGHFPGNPITPGVLLLEAMRSEEHTSELQSHVNLVCRLLLEKKKKTTIHALSDTLRTSYLSGSLPLWRLLIT